ncbi:MAG: metal-sulfur cluster assembly factor [Candidatus Nanohaloarchaea archaeon]
MVTEEEVREQLKEVIDPELDINIVDLGLIYEIEVDEEEVYILMTLTTPGCPLHGVFDEMVRREVGKLENVKESDIEVELTFEPRWSPEKMSDKAKDELGHLPGMQGF